MLKTTGPFFPFFNFRFLSVFSCRFISVFYFSVTVVFSVSSCRFLSVLSLRVAITYPFFIRGNPRHPRYPGQIQGVSCIGATVFCPFLATVFFLVLPTVLPNFMPSSLAFSTLAFVPALIMLRSNSANTPSEKMPYT